jgi:hypothetical protein
MCALGQSAGSRHRNRMSLHPPIATTEAASQHFALEPHLLRVDEVCSRGLDWTAKFPG